MGQYRILDDDLTQLEVQKLAYFLQLAGCDLKLKFSKQLYGPYADPLYHMLLRLEGHFIQGLEDRTPHAVLRVEPDAINEANSYLKEHDTVGPAFRRVSKLIEGFETPYGMELLATTHWVARETPAAAQSDEAAIEAIGAWNRRKASTFEPSHIKTAWSRLHDASWPLRA